MKSLKKKVPPILLQLIKMMFLWLMLPSTAAEAELKLAINNSVLVLCDDISRSSMEKHGTSLYPIPVINDMDNDPLDPRFNYTEWNVDSEGKFKEKHKVSTESVRYEQPPPFQKGCSCEGKCGEDCECVKRSTIHLYEVCQNAASADT